MYIASFLLLFDFLKEKKIIVISDYYHNFRKCFNLTISFFSFLFFSFNSVLFVHKLSHLNKYKKNILVKYYVMHII